MTQTTALSWFRPVAKAFGTSVSATATRGFFMSLIAQMRSMTPCSSGASCSLTTLPCIANSASLSEKKYWTRRNPTAMTSTSTHSRGTKTMKKPTKTT